MRPLWTDELSDQIAKDAESWRYRPADLMTWVCLALGPLLAAAVVGIVLRWYR